MLRKLLIAPLLAMVSIAQSSDPVSPLLKQCLTLTDEYGVFDNSNVSYVSNLDGIINKLQRNVLFMRTTDFYVCHDEQYVHGIRVVLQHDPAKDP